MSLLLDALRKAAESKNRPDGDSESSTHGQHWPAGERGERDSSGTADRDAAQRDEPSARDSQALHDPQDRADQTIPPPIPGFELPGADGRESGIHGENASNAAAGDGAGNNIGDDTRRRHSDAELARELRGLHSRLRSGGNEQSGEPPDSDEVFEHQASDGQPERDSAPVERPRGAITTHDSAVSDDSPADDDAPIPAPAKPAAERSTASGPAGVVAREPYDEFDETQRLDEPDEPGRDSGARLVAQPGTPQQARNLFTSKSVRKPIRQRPNMLVLVLVLASLGAVGAWLYYGYGEHQFSLQRDLARIRSSAPIQPGPRSAEQDAAVRAEAEANGLPQVAAAGSDDAPATPAATDDQAGNQVAEPASASAGDTANGNSIRSVPPAESLTAAAEAGSAAAAHSAPGESDSPPQQSLQGASQQSPSQQQPAQKPIRRASESGNGEQIADGGGARQPAPSQASQSPVSRTGDAAASGPRNGSLSIARSQRDAPIDQLVKDGYGAYQAGQLDVASNHYRKALGIDGNHRDALLGAAAVALRGGNGADAARHYQRLLQLNPRDPAALVGLRSLSQSGDPAQLETELSLLLEQAPESAPLHFALGGVYSRGRRWGEAQQAYFNAHRLDAGNPDYLYNLAISLDNLGKRNAAADFYRQALEAAQQRAASFDQNATMARLRALQGAQQ